MLRKGSFLFQRSKGKAKLQDAAWRKCGGNFNEAAESEPEAAPAPVLEASGPNPAKPESHAAVESPPALLPGVEFGCFRHYTGKVKACTMHFNLFTSICTTSGYAFTAAQMHGRTRSMPYRRVRWRFYFLVLQPPYHPVHRAAANDIEFRSLRGPRLRVQRLVRLGHFITRLCPVVRWIN